MAETSCLSPSDFTAENGATMLWPRSHFNRLARSVNHAEAVMSELPRGSALVYLGSITHCGGANRSTRPRTGLILSDCLGWLKQYRVRIPLISAGGTEGFSRRAARANRISHSLAQARGYEGQDPSVLFQTTSPACRRPMLHPPAYRTNYANSTIATPQ